MNIPEWRQNALSVSAFNRLIQQTLGREIPLCWIAGEISGLTRAASGHWYFVIKDITAQVRCVMFRSKNQFIDWQPQNGQLVEVRASAGLYEPRGEFQLQVETLRQAGAGALFEAFERLKKKLQAEGLFDDQRKRPITPMPRKIGIITSPSGAALHDVLSTLRRLMPHLPVIIYPCQVQGNGSIEQICDALLRAGQRDECDTLIVCRGGGSMEDLWSFNDERVVRAIATSPLPVISGVGHETDFTIADFVADLRAPTPTAAATLCARSRDDWQQALDRLQQRLNQTHQSLLGHIQHRLQWLSARLVHPGERLRNQQNALQHLAQRLHSAMHRLQRQHHHHFHQLSRQFLRLRPTISRHSLLRHAQALQLSMRQQQQRLALRQTTLHQHLELLNPLRVLDRGYSLITDASGQIIRNTQELNIGEHLHLQFASGSAVAQVVSTIDKDAINPIFS